MNDGLRRAVAYIAGRMVSGDNASAVYDFEASQYFSFSGEVTPQRVNVYDYERSCHLGGTPRSLYDYGASHHFDLEVKGDRFKGYDYATSTHFDGRVNGRSISLYDYGTSRYYNFSF